MDEKETAIVKRPEQEVSTLLPSAQNLRMLAQDLLNSGLFPGVKNIAGAITVIEFGRELGIPPVSALQTMAVVNGRLCMESKALLALFQKNGGRIKIVERSKIRAKIELSKDGMETYVHEYTMEQAKTERLSEKDTWKKMPETMLYWRAIATGIRAYDPGAIFGLYSKEEMADISVPTENGGGVGRGMATYPTNNEKQAPVGQRTANNGPSGPVADMFGETIEDHPESVIDGEVVDAGKEPPVDEAGDGFFDDKPEDESPLFAEGHARDEAAGGIVATIKDSLQVEGVDEKRYKQWLWHYQTTMKPVRQFVGMKFGHASLSEGNVADLKWLHGKLADSIRKFRAWEKKQ
jgi:hypothetical protein